MDNCRICILSLWVNPIPLIYGTLIDQEINIHGWASFLPTWLMFMHVEGVKALMISSLQRLVVKCQVPT